MNEFRVLNDKGDIEVKILKPANAVFQTDEFHVDSTVTVYKNAFNIFNLVLENQQLKERVKYLEDNWNKLKEYMSDENISNLFERGYQANDFIEEIRDITQEIEGSDSNVKD